jgi:RNA polymerase sigma-70 factor (ECF subfamily)
MPDDTGFLDLIDRLRARDDRAAAEVVRRFEAGLRQAVRVRLTHPALRRRLDPLDICQMVLASFFSRAARGRYELTSPGQLLRLLTTMARNQIHRQVRALRARRRGGHLTQKASLQEGDLVDPGPDHTQEVAHGELLELFHSRLSAGERWLKEQRGLGRTWAVIAAEIGVNPDALRMRYNRKVSQVARELRLGE